jgi:multiple antibiotic resistance protein
MLVKRLPEFSVCAVIVLLGLTLLVVAQTPTPVADPGSGYDNPESARALILTPAKMFTFFFVMLGPLKILGPYARSTINMDIGSARRLAIKAVAISILVGVLGAVVGQGIIVSWGLSLSALLISAGLIMLLIALRAILSHYQSPPPPAPEESDPTGLKASPFSLAFPTIVTPYGVAALILLLGASRGAHDLNIFGIFIAVMAINLLAMWFARPILKYTSGALQVLGALFGVLQVALAVQMMLGGFRLLGVLQLPVN